MKKILCFIFLLCLHGMVYADSCPSSELARLKNIAKHIEFAYDYEIKIKEGTESGSESQYADFKVTVTNLNKDLKVMIENDYLESNYKEFINDGTNQGVLSGFSSGEEITITVRAYVDNDCMGTILLTKNIKFPYLNKYYASEECKNNPTFKYCSKMLDNDITYEEFTNELGKFLGKQTNDDKTDNNDGKSKESKSLNYNMILKYLGIIFIIFIIIISLKLMLRKMRKNSL